MKVLTILVRHGVERYPAAEADLQTVVARQFPDVTRDLIVVDNALPAGAVDRERGHTVLGADNTAREFSAFDRAVSWLGPDIRDYDFVHFATSAFNTLYTSYLARFSRSVLEAAARRPACLGHIDCYNTPVRVGPFTSQHWIRTCFFFLRPSEIEALGSFVSLPDARAIFSSDPLQPFRADAPISGNYQRYIIDWLTGQDIGQGVNWHSKLTLDRASLDGFERKAMTILNEHLLGIRLRAMGCPLIDVTWLSTCLSRTSSADVPWHTPWHAQLAARDVDAVVIR
jgi:hypothetical protein